MNDATPGGTTGSATQEALSRIIREFDVFTSDEGADLLSIEGIVGTAAPSCTDPVGRWVVGELRKLGHDQVVGHDWREVGGDGAMLTVRDRAGTALARLRLVPGSSLWDLAAGVFAGTVPALVRPAPVEVVFADHTLVNLTSHEVVTIAPDGTFTALGANPMSAQVRTARVIVSPMGHPWEMVHERPLGTTHLPAQRAARWLVVSRTVAVRNPHRIDLLVPSDLARDERGMVLWAGALARVGA
ncbi:hypothetical protein BJF83_24765 [Nocardiopsis sp. CNR-923]|uniref:hypothetical protein n=1 Tax=Nocardiopsis sp. CNR-923 TaxID=1904965 RepID=UPI000958F374|nr:hypothetical protein [Nocardiopsis sp. CNR-923]OLT30468.1 hypothetical protein BJF83_24765 [Nocardiopsis sp. CNR-923]